MADDKLKIEVEWTVNEASKAKAAADAAKAKGARK